MQHLYIRVNTISPLAIRSDHASGGAVATNYIPSTTFVGALATVHRFLRPEKRSEFEQWFLSGQILYPNLYPAVFDDTGLQNRNVPVYPVPKTAQTCKRHKGFLFPEEEENDAHGVRDNLIDWALFELGQRKEYNSKNANPLAALEAHKECSRCSERMDSFGGYYRRNDVVKNQLIAAKEHKRLRTHSGIDRKTGTVQEGILYNRQVFEEGMRFWGMAKFLSDGQLISEFASFIDDLRDSKLGNEGLLRMGTGRTRGMGKVTINVERPKDQQDSFASFQKRLNDFNDLLHRQAEHFNLSGLENMFFFALTLHSPLILCDEFLRYRGNIDATRLEKLLDCSVLGLERIYQNARIRRVTGWQELWGVPRTNEYAIEAGSVFLFACTALPDDAVYKALFTLEEQGAGKRQIEGFGCICVSDQFHQEVEML
jgi:CRISPR-associated Csx10 family RAMP protein